MLDDFNTLQNEIVRFLRSPDARFSEIALRLFAFQYAHNAPYRAFCDRLGKSPTEVLSWEQIPPIPAEAFKSESPLSCAAVEECERVFLTSGTTAEVRGRHYLATTEIYRLTVTLGMQRLGQAPGRRAFLARNPSTMPDSSLGCMFDYLSQEDPERCPLWLLSDDGSMNLEPLAHDGEPLTLFSTALSLRHLFDRSPPERCLPDGSWVFQTGGYKGLAIEYAPAELSQDIRRYLGVPPECVLNEYGMTELSSQAYRTGLTNPHQTPPWLKVRSADPETGEFGGAGSSGHLVFYDLGNLNSVLAIRTQDLGHIIDDHTFSLSGRDPNALARGCSRASDAFFQSL